ncbi:39S ribosomal protein L14, mitochondrial [Armadillidium nasatum]|uniref:Large ribosomal subunit protein uL14m n=1 Tax=Armadillidium nasatum TaxID=96803 RepID=A0A5N5SUA2_9CRUS|nr:39S ribosomal protein L14, mitochondrial [Armadillidium nasatum]
MNGRYLLHPLQNIFASCNRSFSTSEVCCQVRKMTRLRVVDNSPIGKAAMLEGKPPKVIHVYTKKKFGYLGDKVLVAIKGQKVKGILVGCVQDQDPFIPKFDSNNVVLIDENGNPLGNRIYVPIPTILRKMLKDKSYPKQADYTKILSIATRFV